MSNLNLALEYLAQGLSIIPLKSPSYVKNSKKFWNDLKKTIEKEKSEPNPRSKKDIYKEKFLKECKLPLVAWKKYQERTPTEKEVTDWFTIWPDANIGIVTGEVSGIVVFDLDKTSAEHYAEEKGGFPDETPTVETGKGRHVYMCHPGFNVKCQVNTNLGLDIRGDGGMVVAPPSVHGSGRTYCWEEFRSIFEVEPADCTPWMIEYLKSDHTEPKSNKAPAEVKADPSEKKEKTQLPSNSTEEKSEKTKYADIIAYGCKKGNRNDTTTRLIGHYLKSGLPEKEIWEIITLWNDTKNDPPLSQDELKKCLKSIAAKEKQNIVKNIESYLDNAVSAISEYNQNYVRIPFAGKTLCNLEKQMDGGLAGGRLYILGGIPSSGKTVLANNMADNICLNGYPVIFFSFDDGKIELRHRTLARFCGQNIENFNLNNAPDISKLFNDQNVNKIIPLKYVVQDMIPIEKWLELIDKVKEKHKKGPVIIIDYLRKLRTDKKIKDERTRVDDIICQLTELAKSQNIPIVAISELARDSYKSGQRLSMASFKESGMIEYEASWLGILAAVEETKPGEYTLKENWENIIKHDGNIDLIIFKAKRGTGNTGRIPLKVDIANMTVKDRISEIKVVKNNNKVPKFN